MSKRGEDRRNRIVIDVPDKQHMHHFETALQIANAYRVAQKHPVLSMERFCLNAIIEAANSVHNFYAAEMKKANQSNQEQSSDEVQAVDESKGNTEDRESGENTDSVGQE